MSVHRAKAKKAEQATSFRLKADAEGKVAQKGCRWRAQKRRPPAEAAFQAEDASKENRTADEEAAARKKANVDEKAALR